jgi:hypothetical protein
MRFRLLAVALLASPVAALAQGLEPGEWQFTTTTAVPGMPSPRTFSTTQCVRKEDASSMPWERKNPGETDCRTTVTKKSGDTTSWQVSCPKSNTHGRGTARIRAGSLESEMTMVLEQGGRKMEMHSKTTGKRLGPCKP